MLRRFIRQMFFFFYLRVPEPIVKHWVLFLTMLIIGVFTVPLIITYLRYELSPGMGILRTAHATGDLVTFSHLQGGSIRLEPEEVFVCRVRDLQYRLCADCAGFFRLDVNLEGCIWNGHHVRGVGIGQGLAPSFLKYVAKGAPDGFLIEDCPFLNQKWNRTNESWGIRGRPR